MLIIWDENQGIYFKQEIFQNAVGNRGYCKEGGKKLKDSNATHCSEKCLFSSIKDSVPVCASGPNPAENEDDPWI